MPFKHLVIAKTQRLNEYVFIAVHNSMDSFSQLGLLAIVSHISTVSSLNTQSVSSRSSPMLYPWWNQDPYSTHSDHIFMGPLITESDLTFPNSTVSNVNIQSVSSTAKTPSGLVQNNIPAEELIEKVEWKKTTSWDRSDLIILTTVNVALSLSCLVLSVLMAYYRIRKCTKRSLVQNLYLQNGLTDLFVGIGVLCQCPIVYLMIWKGKQISDIEIPVYISYIVTAVAIKMSVFMNCVLGTVRCINIVRPFYQINKKALTVITILYLFAWMLMIGFDVWQYHEKRGTDNQVYLLKTFVMKPYAGFGPILTATNKDENGASFSAYYLGILLQLILPTVLPTFICTVLMIVQVYHLLRKRSGKDALTNAENIPKLREDSMASLTIFLLTCIYVGTSTVSVVTALVHESRHGYLTTSKSSYESLTEKIRYAASWNDLSLMYFSLSTCPLICSTFTPLTLLLRGSGPISTWYRKLFARTRETRVVEV